MSACLHVSLGVAGLTSCAGAPEAPLSAPRFGALRWYSSTALLTPEGCTALATMRGAYPFAVLLPDGRVGTVGGSPHDLRAVAVVGSHSDGPDFPCTGHTWLPNGLLLVANGMTQDHLADGPWTALDVQRGVYCTSNGDLPATDFVDPRLHLLTGVSSDSHLSVPPSAACSVFNPAPGR